mmetsp:Transcript_28792/g.35632  ORF Transcript_28792/g.35632 Transcript_28792/m.35632 type:complete len:97 (+) Transcript_28792:1762-2052(+)
MFKNPSFAGHSRMQRVQSIGSFDTWDVRFWKEFFCQYSEPIHPVETGYVPDAEKQVDLAIEEEIDQQVLLQALLQRSEKQIELLHLQSNQVESLAA